MKTSSGYDSLDRTTCSIALARVRYEPARDGASVPIASTVILPVRWILSDS